ncbi:MAG: glycosyltransferase family 39 protein [Actinomycetota bacterium]|nr:glycosyltransferase family 39 protein [Actinomycetota bacterium]
MAAAQALAAGAISVSALLLAVSHLLSTSTFDLLAWTAVSWLVVRVLRGTADQRWWLLVGLVAGVGLLNKSLLVFLLAGLFVGVIIAGPRKAVLSRWLWLGAGLAFVIWLPNLIWQSQHGWPQLQLSRQIASGSSGTSQPAALFVPFQLVLISPALVPVWAAGLVRLIRDPGLVRVRAFAVAYALLTLVFLLTGGKPYYLGGLYPVLLAAGAPPTVRWLGRGRRRLRRSALVAALALSAVVDTALMLPVVPVQVLHATPIVAVNYDAGETVGWPRFVATVAGVYKALPPAERRQAVLLTENYGEAGALDHFGPALGLPPAFSGHNGYGEWGPPRSSGGPVIAVGIDRRRLEQLFGSVQASARIDNGVHLDNDEQGTTVWICRDQRRPWSQAWAGLRHLG